MRIKPNWICGINGTLINLNYVTNIWVEGNNVFAAVYPNYTRQVGQCNSEEECQEVIASIRKHLEDV